MTSITDEIKTRLTIAEVWERLGYPGKPTVSCATPWRPDRKPSFSVFSNSQLYKDHATGEGGTVLDFIQRALNVDLAGAIRWAKEALGEAPPIRQSAAKPPPDGGTKPKIPPLRMPKAGELEALARLRGFQKSTLETALSLGLLRFTDYAGKAAWCVTDAQATMLEARRLDGLPWDAFGHLPARKCHAWGHQKNFPLNLRCIPPGIKALAWVEGGPDLLAALEVILREGKADRIAPVAVLGAANNRLSPEALPFVEGKTLRLFPHADPPGRKAAREWARFLKAGGAAHVDAFDLSGLIRTDGQPGKDLCDYLHLSADCWEANQKFQNDLLP